MGAEPMSAAGLGRALTLGALYDCRSDGLVSGLGLWDSAALDQAIRRTPIGSSKLDLVPVDSLDAKAAALGINPDLKLSLLAGLVSPSGAGRYWEDGRSQGGVVRAALKFGSGHSREELAIEALGSLAYPVDNHTATHVVTGVEYGAEAFLVFEKAVEKGGTEKRVQAQLTAEVAKLKSLRFDPGSDAPVDMNGNQVSLDKGISVRFHGDVQLPVPPSTLAEAVGVMRDLPDLLAAAKVPKKAYLYPLAELDPGAAKLARGISTPLLNRVASQVQQYRSLGAEAGGLAARGDVFPFLAEELELYGSLVEAALDRFKTKLRGVLPKVRGGSAAEADLDELLGKWSASCLSAGSLTKCLAGLKSTEVRLRSFVEQARKGGIPVLQDGSLGDFAMSKAKVLACCLNSPALLSKSLEEIQAAVYGDPFTPPSGSKEWFQEDGSLQCLQGTFSAFRRYHEINGSKRGSDGDKDLYFVLTATEGDCAGRMACRFYDWGMEEEMELPSAPGKAEVVAGSATTSSARLRFAPSASGSAFVTAYQVEWREESATEMKTMAIPSSAAECEVRGLEPGKAYRFCVRALSKAGLSPDGGWSELLITKAEDRRALRMLAKSKMVADTNKDVVIYTPKHRAPRHAGGGVGVEKFELGERRLDHTGTGDKTILVVGATGTGKTTFLNSMGNFLYQVEPSDGFRFKIITQAEDGAESSQSRTKKVTAYVLHDTCLPYSLTVVDTPGYGDTEGLKADKHTTKLIKDLFESKGGVGVDRLDAVCLVVKSTDTRMTAQQRHNFESVFQLFGKNLAERIFIVATFCDASEPPVIKCLTDAEIKFRSLFKFNNSAFFEGPKEQRNEQVVQEMFWELGQANFRSFFEGLGALGSAVSLSQSAEVLRKREELENTVLQLHEKVTEGLHDLEEMRKVWKVMEDKKAEILRNEAFTYDVEEMKLVHEDISNQGIHTTTCLKCNHTCHNGCGIPDNADKAGCIAMDSGYCMHCSNKCHWSEHKNVAYIVKQVRTTVTRTSKDMQAKYNKATGEKNAYDAMLNSLGMEFGTKQMSILECLTTIRKSIEKLEEIAQRPSYLTDAQYIDVLIQVERDDGKPGYLERVAHLVDQKKLADLLAKSKKADFNPFDQHEKEQGGWKEYIMHKFLKWSK